MQKRGAGARRIKARTPIPVFANANTNTAPKADNSIEKSNESEDANGGDAIQKSELLAKRLRMGASLRKAKSRLQINNRATKVEAETNRRDNSESTSDKSSEDLGSNKGISKSSSHFHAIREKSIASNSGSRASRVKHIRERSQESISIRPNEPEPCGAVYDDIVAYSGDSKEFEDRIGTAANTPPTTPKGAQLSIRNYAPSPNSSISTKRRIAKTAIVSRRKYWSKNRRASKARESGSSIDIRASIVADHGGGTGKGSTGSILSKCQKPSTIGFQLDHDNNSTQKIGVKYNRIPANDRSSGVSDRDVISSHVTSPLNPSMQQHQELLGNTDNHNNNIIPPEDLGSLGITLSNRSKHQPNQRKIGSGMANIFHTTIGCDD
ncbi:hypothetical protein H4219_000868, partial [Mycoemilia scoparia]